MGGMRIPRRGGVSNGTARMLNMMTVMTVMVIMARMLGGAIG